MDDAISKGRQPKNEPPHYYGENHPKSKLKWNDVNEIRKMRKIKGLSVYKLAKEFYVSPSTIWHIVRNDTWI
jgi:hypothetical protein